MKMKWIVATVLLIGVVIISGLGILYTVAKKPEQNEFAKYEELVKSQGLLSTVSEVYAYNSVTSYVTVIGKSSEGQDVAYIIDKAENQTAYEVNLSDGISAEEAEQRTRAEGNVEKIMSIKLGHEEIGPVWEVTYLNTNDALGYTYLDFKSGDWWKRISNL
ncbi:uncharacterized protein YpmB [Chryseomicrobium aureum]|uniref:cell wall elongation regulator TseB-like domain-containing protein n=1 Tax=Chryseomicrobium aureum TaxID=1441723 RepID=UPI00195A234A|nr:DUF5590 domain-containing protein [Chryseomicrobium aureum]MBM7705544.1 uncharacterized protein YpmB [Chryseomicrobium aureum]